MASRFDQPNEPDLDRYETRTDDIDVPDFDTPDQSVDPAEHAAQAIHSAVDDLKRMITTNHDLDRAWELRNIAKQVCSEVEVVAMKSSDKIDEILERRR